MENMYVHLGRTTQRNQKVLCIHRIHTYTHAHTSMHVYIYICVYIYVYIYIYVYMYICIHAYVYVCLFVFMCVYVHIYICIYRHTYRGRYVCMYVCMYVCVCVCQDRGSGVDWSGQFSARILIHMSSDNRQESVGVPLFLYDQEPVLQNLRPPRHHFPGRAGKGGPSPRLIIELSAFRRFAW